MSDQTPSPIVKILVYAATAVGLLAGALAALNGCGGAGGAG